MPPASSAMPILSRRNFIAVAGGALFAPSLAGQQKSASPSPRLLQLNAYPINAETPVDLFTTYITPNDLFFVRHHWNPVVPEPRQWTLQIDGEVERPLKLTLADLRSMPRTVTTSVLQCAGNGRGLYRPIIPGMQWTHGAMGNARWGGVTIAELLKRAGVKPSAKHLRTFGHDGPPGKVPPFHRSIDLQKALADCLVAYEMNGEPLPELHGGPARLIVPGWTGNHWMKWLARLTPHEQPQTGFYMDTGYRYPKQPGPPGTPVKPEETEPVTELFVKSTITQAPRRARVGSAVTIGGVAFSGTPDIATVEISDDDGATWRAATLASQHDPYAWRLWSFQYTPAKAGAVKLFARATDGRGRVQPREAVWNPSGYLHNAWHAVDIEVSA